MRPMDHKTPLSRSAVATFADALAHAAGGGSLSSRRVQWPIVSSAETHCFDRFDRFNRFDRFDLTVLIVLIVLICVLIVF